VLNFNIIKKHKTFFALLLIFFVALAVRFLYFSKDIYFAYDQARDAYVSLKAVQGDFKIVGPPATFKDIFHGALFYYPFGFIYYLSHKSPLLLSALLRIYNALGVFLIFLVARVLTKNNKVGYIASTIYAFSFEQTQYSLFLGHPPLAVPWVIVFYLGLTMLIFSNNKYGLIIALLGLGLAIQFHFSAINLFLVLVTYFLIFRKKLPSVDIKTGLYSVAALMLGVSTYALAEIKFNFRSTKALLNFFSGTGQGGGFYPKNILIVTGRFVKDNVFSSGSVLITLFIFAYLAVGILLFKKQRRQILFLTIWLLAGLIPYALGESSTTVYYYSIGGSLSLIILFSMLIARLLKISRLLGFIVIVVILQSNLGLIRKYNPTGTIPEINVQDKMLVGDEMKVLDFIYEKADGADFSVNALTIPYNVNTTWSYLFEWYGESAYGYVPVWGGANAEGFEGNLKVITAQSELPDKRFTILEPTRGLPGRLKEEFLKNEGIFWAVKEQQIIGEFIVQEREKI
jgi:hypothetical protein